MSRQSGKITVPDDLRDLLLEFTISYLLEQPGDILDYAVEFFTKLRENRQTTLIKLGHSESADDSLSMEDEPPKGRYTSRRKSVFAEAYDPEEDEEDGEKEQMQKVLDAMFERQVQPDEWIINQGEDGDNFYVIERGIFNAYVLRENEVEPMHVHTYENCGSFGELALLYNMPRAASVKATTQGSLWAMDRLTFRRIILKSAFKKRKMYEQLIESVPMLKALQPYERMNVADALMTKSYGDGERIIIQGDCADGMYFVESGEVQITILGDNSQEIEVNRIQKGGYFGELALVTHKPRAASAYAVGDIKLAFLDVEAFERLLGPCMQIMKRNITDYEEQLIKIFGSKNNITDIR
ncbi:hypothetical protein RUM43_014539 [Polyplax serrata]|uniref:Cyclic nucleotide-binding domain-containing protein n=1 Tax=Polyplax serrata TaxID=468196 RepID=A0AAN8S6R9_POLSC